MDEKDKIYKENFDRLTIACTNAYIFNPENPEQKKEIEIFSERINKILTSGKSKNEKLNELKNRLTQCKSDLDYSQRIGNVGRAISFKKPYNEALLKYFIKQLKIFIKHVKNQNEIPKKENPEPEPKPENWYPEIFKQPEYFKLFIEYLKRSEKKSYLRDYSFIYWAMKKEKTEFIVHHIEPGHFRAWFNRHLEELEKLTHPLKLEDLNQSLKTYDEARTHNRETRYKDLKDIHCKTRV